MILRAGCGAAIVIALATCGTQAPQSRAQRIGKLEEVIGGPHAVGEVGDFILENDQIRLIIADKSFRLKDGTEVAAGRVNTTFGGTLIDADLQRPAGDTHGNDQLAELLPGFVFTVIDPTDVSVTADGSDGGPAEVTVTGIGGDLFEMVSLLNTGLVFPSTNPPLEMTQVYRLEPGKKYVTIETTIKNPDSGAHPFPYLMPSQLDSLLGMNIPGISSLQLSAPLGQFPLLGGEQSLFVPGIAGFNVRFAIQDSYKQASGFPAFPGMVADFLASRGPGVSYGLTIPATADNYVNTFNTGYGNQKITPYSMLLPFTYAGVTGAYMYNPPAQLQAGEQRTYESYFVIGKGDVASVLDTIYEIRNQPTGTFGGYLVDSQTSAPVANANVIVLDSDGNPLDQMTTDDGGAFFGHLAPGSYSYRVLADDRVTTDAQPFTITAGQATGVFVTIAPPASLAVSVVDELGRHAPVKIQLIGHNSQIKGIDGRDILYSLTLGERVRPTAYDGTDRYVENAWWTVDGNLNATVRPGTYDLVVSRGPEYELYTKTISIGAGSYAAELVQLQRSFSSDGWIAADFHIHAQPSTDSGLPIPLRVASCAAEGLDVATATDHNFITDYAPVIGATGLSNWLLGIPGMELTTFEMGHFIGFPLTVDPGSTRGGEFQWFHQTPGDLFATLRGLATDPASAIVDVAHPRQPVLGYFSQFFIDQDTALPYAPSGILGVFAPYGMEFQAPAYSHRLRCARARHRPSARRYPHVQGAEPAARGAVPRSAAGARPGRARRRRPPDVPRGRRDLVHDARPRPVADRPRRVRQPPDARRRAGLCAHDDLRRTGQGRARCVHARRRDRRDQGASRGRDDRTAGRDDDQGRDDRRHRGRQRSDDRCRHRGQGAELGRGQRAHRLLERRRGGLRPADSGRAGDLRGSRAGAVLGRLLDRRGGQRRLEHVPGQLRDRVSAARCLGDHRRAVGRHQPVVAADHVGAGPATPALREAVRDDEPDLGRHRRERLARAETAARAGEVPRDPAAAGCEGAIRRRSRTSPDERSVGAAGIVYEHAHVPRATCTSSYTIRKPRPSGAGPIAPRAGYCPSHRAGRYAGLGSHVPATAHGRGPARAVRASAARGLPAGLGRGERSGARPGDQPAGVAHARDPAPGPDRLRDVVGRGHDRW